MENSYKNVVLIKKLKSLRDYNFLKAFNVKLNELETVKLLNSRLIWKSLEGD